ncbi:MAG TPA: PLD nuclease N-terminal domain-containing protein [Bacteroidia bacterium]|nr:PLD nuclease N-terminal domain-containing protein [Bacteroidia bacterium]
MIELILILLLLMLPGLIALIDILRHDFRENQKLVWLIAVLFVPLVGTIAYFAIGRKQRTV